MSLDFDPESYLPHAPASGAPSALSRLGVRSGERFVIALHEGVPYMYDTVLQRDAPTAYEDPVTLTGEVVAVLVDQLRQVRESEGASENQWEPTPNGSVMTLLDLSSDVVSAEEDRTWAFTDEHDVDLDLVQLPGGGVRLSVHRFGHVDIPHEKVPDLVGALLRVGAQDPHGLDLEALVADGASAPAPTSGREG